MADQNAARYDQVVWEYARHKAVRNLPSDLPVPPKDLLDTLWLALDPIQTEIRSNIDTLVADTITFINANVADPPTFMRLYSHVQNLCFANPMYDCIDKSLAVWGKNANVNPTVIPRCLQKVYWGFDSDPFIKPIVLASLTRQLAGNPGNWGGAQIRRFRTMYAHVRQQWYPRSVDEGGKDLDMYPNILIQSD